MSEAPNKIADGDSAAMGRVSPSRAGVSSLDLPGGSLPPMAAGHFSGGVAPPIPAPLYGEAGSDPMPMRWARAAADVPIGEAWVDRTHRTVAEADRQMAERMRGGPGRAFKPAAFEIPDWVPGDLREDYVDLALQCGEEHAASVVRDLKRAAKAGRP
jgi:hypothetical protein